MTSIILRKVAGVLTPLLRRRAPRSFGFRVVPGRTPSLFGFLSSWGAVAFTLLALLAAWILVHPLPAFAHQVPTFGLIGMAYGYNSTDAIYLKPEATFNTAPGASGAEVMRIKPSQGFSLTRPLIDSEESLSDALGRMARLGGKTAPGTFELEGSVDGQDTVHEALTRSTWVAATTITFDAGGVHTNLQVTSTSQLTLTGSGSWLTDGVRVGDIIRIANYSTAADNGINLRVKTVTATVITVFGTPLTAGATDTACTVTIARKLKNGTSPTERTFYFDQYNGSLDLSQAIGGAKFASMRIVGQPNGLAQQTVTLLGASLTPLTSGASPYYSSPTQTTNQSLCWIDGAIAIGGVDTAVITAFEINYIIPLTPVFVIGSTTPVDIVPGRAKITGSVSFVRTDLSYVTALGAETEYEFHVMLVENESEPKDFLAYFLPRVKLISNESPVGGDDVKIETCNYTTGKKEGFSSTGYDDTLWTVSTSAT